MGNQESSSTKQNFKQRFQLEKYNLKDKKQDDVYGEIVILEDPSIKEQNILKQKMINDEYQLSQISQELDKKTKKGNDNMIKLVQYNIQPDESLCASTYIVYTVWEYLEQSLNSEIEKKKLYTSNQLFKEHFLFKLIKNVINALSYLQANSKPHQSLNSSNILFDSKTDNFKIVDSEFFNQTPNLSKWIQFTSSSNNHQYNNTNSNNNNNNIHKNINNNINVSINKQEFSDNIYLSPEQMEALKKRVFDQQIDLYKADVFVFAVIILETILLKYQKDIYNIKEFNVKQDILEYKLQQIQVNYSFHLIDFLQECLNYDVKKRPDWLQLKKKYSDLQIIEKEQNKSNNNVLKQTQASKFNDNQKQDEHSSM